MGGLSGHFLCWKDWFMGACIYGTIENYWTMFLWYEVAVYAAFQFLYSNVQVCKLCDPTFDIIVFQNHAKQYLK